MHCHLAGEQKIYAGFSKAAQKIDVSVRNGSHNRELYLSFKGNKVRKRSNERGYGGFCIRLEC